MSRDSREKAIVLRTRRWGETSRRVSLLTEGTGLIEAVVFGAQKGSRKASVSLFDTVDCLLYYSPVKKEYTLKEATVVKDRSAIREDLSRTGAAAFLSEFSLRIEGGDGDALYELAEEAFDALSDGVSVYRILIQGVGKLFSAAGMETDYRHCENCGRTFTEDEVLGYSSSLQIPVCAACRDSGESLALPPGARRYLAYTAPLSFAEAISVGLSETAERRIARYMLRRADILCSGTLKSLGSGMLDLG